MYHLKYIPYEDIDEKIIELHTSQKYKVYMLGFLPGFVFMGKIPVELQCNRKVTPRLRVPASSVGIAGFQTGIYPTVSPGGWQILGRTPLKIFDPQKEHPFLLHFFLASISTRLWLQINFRKPILK